MPTHDEHTPPSEIWEADTSDAPPPYRVTLPIFEGPLDLLLHLVRREELDITAISLAQVTEQYLTYLDAWMAWTKQQDILLDPSPLAEFIAVAARLLWIKSRMLLPRPETDEDDEEDDPAEALARKLREYERFKEAATRLAAWQEEQGRSYTRIASPPTPPPPANGLEVSQDDLLGALRRALAEKAEKPGDPAMRSLVAPHRVTVRDQMMAIQKRLQEHSTVRFSELLEQATTRIEIIVTFLALLELLKQCEVEVHQEGLFTEIVIQATPPTPAAAATEQDPHPKHQ